MYRSIAQPGEKLILIEKIFRVPLLKYVLGMIETCNNCLELPAGFKDEQDTDPTESGLRELKEETGYIGENAKSSKT